MENKTNVMRLLDKAGISYRPHYYKKDDGKIDGTSVAEKLGLPPERVFKTLVTRSAKGFFVFVIPVNRELDLKKCARAAGQKAVEMLHLSELTKVTGYIRGGCSPIGMKKQYATFLDASALAYETIVFSAGKIGAQVELAPDGLVRLTGAAAADLTE